LTSAAVLLLCALPLLAQQEQVVSSVAPAVEPIETPPADSGIEPTATVPSTILPKNDRLFFVMPNYLTVEGQQQFPPLTTGTKFKLSAKTMTDPVTVSFIGVIAMVGQAQNSDPSYGTGVSGYAKRYATFYADTGIGTLMTTSVLPTLLRQDPRYFQLGHGGTWRRAMYSVSRIFVTRGDNGGTQFNSSEILGTAVAAGISNTYHPQDQRTLGNTVSVWGRSLMLNAICNVAKEFWPDLRRKLRKPAE
jgi:hypothetical protein